MTVIACILGLAFLAWRLSRRRRAERLAGLDGNTPTYSVAPPTRSLVRRRDHRW